METPQVTTVSGVNLSIKQVGKVVSFTIGYTPTRSGFITLSTNFPKNALPAFRVRGILTSGPPADSWAVLEASTLRIYVTNAAEINYGMAFSMTYITTE